MAESASRQSLFLTVLIVLLAVALSACAPVARPATDAPAAPATANGAVDGSVLLLAPQHTHDQVEAWVADNFAAGQVTIVSEVDASRPPDIMIGVDNYLAEDPFAMGDNATPGYTVDTLPVAGQNAAAVAQVATGLVNELLPELGTPQSMPYVFDREEFVVTTFPTTTLSLTGVITVPKSICCTPRPMGYCVDCSKKSALVVQVPDEEARTQFKNWLAAQAINAPIVVKLAAEGGAVAADIPLSADDMANLPPTIGELLDAYRN